MTVDSDKTLPARLAAIARKLETITGSPAPASLERDFTTASQLKRIEDAVDGGVFSAHDLGAHLDVTLTSPTDGAFLRYDSGLAAWKDFTPPIAITDLDLSSLDLDSLSDVTLSSPASGQYLSYNGTTWVNDTISIDDLSDVLITAPAFRHTLYWDGTKWINSVHYLGSAQHADVVISTPAAGKVLMHNGSFWLDQYMDLDDLNDVTTAGASVRQVLTYDGLGTWQPEYPAIENASDTTFSLTAQKDILQFNGSGQWVNLPINQAILYGDWDMGDYDITADAFISNMNLASSQHTNFTATNNVTETATAGGKTIRGLYVDLDYTYNGVFDTSVVKGLQLDFNAALTAGFVGGTIQPIDVNVTYASTITPTIPAFDFRATATNAGSTFGGSSALAAFFMQATASGVGFTALRSEAVASSAAAAATDASHGYLGYASGAGTYTGNLIGVRGFATTTNAANGCWGLLGQPSVSGTIAQNRKVSVGGVGGHFFANGGSGIFTNSVGATFQRPADITTTHLNFNTNYGELYVQGASEFDGIAHFDGDIDHNGTNLGFYGTTPVARPAAYTQTYATATRTHAAFTAASLTDSTGGTADTTLAAVSGSGDDATINNNFADLTAQVNALLADLANAKQVMNQVLDDLQLIGLLQ